MTKNYKIEAKPVNSSFNDEQWQAIQQKGNNILISASAGSGKTTVLIERIFNHIIQEFAQIDELLVVTFTEAAANEMKERMENRLKSAVNTTIDSNEQARLVEQLSLLAKANIQTLHSFCLEVIQNFFYLIDFNPNFTLITDVTQIQLMYQEVWDEMIQLIYESSNELTISSITATEYDYLLSKYTDSRSDESLFNIVIELFLFARSQPNPIDWLEHADEVASNFSSFTETYLFKQTIQPFIKNKVIEANKCLLEAKSIMAATSDETIEKYESLINNELDQSSAIYEALMNENFEGLFNLVDQLVFNNWKANRKNSEDYELVNEMKRARDEAKALMESILTLFTYDYELTKEIEDKVSYDIQHLSQLTQLFMSQLAKYKTHYSLIDYNDLEHLTLEILAPIDRESQLRKPSSAALYYQSRFKEIMIDEFQDINDIQNSILFYLSHETRNDLDKNLFMVGDVKQSIYGFRMAEPSLFLDKYRSYQSSDRGELIILDKNYRSRDEVLQFTNFIFERIMNMEFGEMDYGPEESLTTGNHSFLPTAPSEAFNIEFKLYEKEDDQETEREYDEESSDDTSLIDSSLEAQAHLIAQDIIHKINSNYHIYDKELKESRPVRYSDFVILTSTRNPFLVTQRIFELYELPLFAQKIENYFQRQEVQLMIALLKLIDNPLQDIPLVAILRSYFVQLSDEELSLIRINHPNGLFYEAVIEYVQSEESDSNTQEKLRFFIRQLERWQHIADNSSLVDLIWTIYQDTSFLDYVAGLSNGVQREANLHALYQKAQDFEQSQFKGVFGFIQFIEQMMQQQNDLAEPVLLESDQEAVRIMTVHASKGLEFPVVYLMDTAKKFNLQDARTKPYIASKHYGLSSDYYDIDQWIRFKSFSKQAFKIEKENTLKAEEMRKLYVALTRCEQKLIIVGSVKNQISWEEKLSNISELHSANDLLVSQSDRQSASSWLDWMQQALAIGLPPKSHTDFHPKQVNIEFINKDQLMSHDQMINLDHQYTIERDIQKIIDQLSIDNLQDTELYNQLSGSFRAEYPYQLSTRTSSYQSVSELKRLYEEPRIDKIDYFVDRRETQTKVESNVTDEEEMSIQGIRYTADTFQPPAFLNEEQSSLTYAEIGSATHFVLQHLDFSKLIGLDVEASRQFIRDSIMAFNQNAYLSEEMMNKINVDSIIQFIESDIGQLTISNAHNIRREQAFSYLTEAKTIFAENLSNTEIEELDGNQLLIHGVIDNFIEFEDYIIIFDYKTDRYKPYSSLDRKGQINQLIDKYRFQISLYSKALEVAFSKPVRKTYIILLDFGESVELTDFYKL